MRCQRWRESQPFSVERRSLPVSRSISWLPQRGHLFAGGAMTTSPRVTPIDVKPQRLQRVRQEPGLMSTGMDSAVTLGQLLIKADRVAGQVACDENDGECLEVLHGGALIDQHDRSFRRIGARPVRVPWG